MARSTYGLGCYKAFGQSVSVKRVFNEAHEGNSFYNSSNSEIINGYRMHGFSGCIVKHE